MGNLCCHYHKGEPPSEICKTTASLSAHGKMIHIVVRSMGGNAVLDTSVSDSVTVASICQQVAVAIDTRAGGIQLQCGPMRCHSTAKIANYIETGKADCMLELTYVVGMAPVFELSSFRGTGVRDSTLKYEWNIDYDPVDAFTIMCWVKTESSEDHYFVSRGAWTEGYSLGVMAKEDGRGTLRGWMAKTLYSNTPIDINKWYHFAFVFTGSALHELQMYVSGKLDNSCTITTFPSQHFAQTGLWIGGEALGLGRTHQSMSPRHFLKGEMREVRIYADAWSAEEIQKEFSHGVPNPT